MMIDRGALFLTLLLASPPLLAQTDTPLRSLVHGRILHAVTGEPVAGVLVSFGPDRVVTDSTGEYRLIVLSQRDGLRAETTGFYPERSFLSATCGGGIVGVDPPSCVVRKDVRIRPLPDLRAPSLSHCELRGTVSSPGQPRRFGWSTMINARADLGTLADSLSNYRIPDVPRGLYWVDAIRTGSPTESRLIYVRCSAERPWVHLDFSLSIGTMH